MSPTLLPSTTPELLGWMLQSALCLGACWLLYRCALQQEQFFHYNRRFLQFTPWLALLLPRLVSAGLEYWPTEPSSGEAGAVSSGGLLPGPTVQAVGSVLYSLPQWLPLLYLGGVLLMLALLASRVLRLWLRTRHLPREIRNGYVLVRTGGQLPTSSFGRWILWDETIPLTPAEAQAVLAHEIAHVQQGHTAEKLRLELVRALLWPVPFVHLFPRALAQVQEFMADSAALRLASPVTASPTAYASLLARLALRSYQPDLPLTQSFTQSLTLTRIRMLTQSSTARRWKQWLLLPLGTALLAGVAACEQAGELPPPPPTTVAEAALAPPPPPPPALYEGDAQTPPGYPGGMTQLLADVMKRVKYPAAAKQAKVAGAVFVRFVVNDKGLIQDAEVMKAPSGPEAAVEALKSEALMAVKTLPGRWTPCQRDGKAVAARYTIPITFALK
ncbi:M56 family metallopeptidase [Hymenobacter pini]|uniref:M56 family metallopeptidase n=1 Tax=Hymenobacter pini TaxID=2880879 RepID=UPI001CF3ED46|nr:M56 family metallopeptidase [Hymenobacter pini]MCA8832333.1 M56 family metallopeptidase [Hymenobacter pini]